MNLLIARTFRRGKQKCAANNIREVLIDGASKIEQLSRSYNRRVADLIVWIANSMSQPTTITPGSNQNFSGRGLSNLSRLQKTIAVFFRLTESLLFYSRNKNLAFMVSLLQCFLSSHALAVRQSVFGLASRRRFSSGFLSVIR